MGEDFNNSKSTADANDHLRFKALLIGTVAVIALGIWLVIWEFIIGINVPGFDAGLLVIALWILFVVLIARKRINFSKVLK